ncbi:LysR family transcriptional regulator [Afifella sp. IM 167]|uniref:LysR family transcriptional regulator n=1 Tax=Afifella sp. IM 167 TaxID=2033586 RepID=UPI001CCD2161|nr:LysR family transcriptional regulator [Afifella sp. IM 167]MBZ8134336.1 LysR family transcriptional regulator [Afifella sp. IM 167]
MFDLKDVEIVRLIVRHGGFRAAAAQIRQSQSAVSARVAALEERLGVELFDRRKRRGGLTPAGRTFLDQTAGLLEMRERILGSLSQETGFAGTIRIGVAETIVHTWLPRMMTLIRERYPGLRIELAVDTSPTLAAKLLEDELDVAVMMEPLVPARATGHFIYGTAIDWFASTSMPLADQQLSVEELAGFPIITFPKGTIPYREVEAVFADAHLRAAPLLHGCASLSAAIHLVQTSFGIGVLPVKMVEAEMRAGRIRRLETAEAAKPRPLRFVFTHMDTLDPLLAEGLRAAAEHAVQATDDLI